MKIKVKGYYYPAIETAVSGREWAVFPEELPIRELAQLFVDLCFLPQPQLRGGEAHNLAMHVYRIGQGRVGRRFDRLAALRLLHSAEIHDAEANLVR